MNTSFGVIGGDLRIVKLAKMLADDGNKVAEVYRKGYQLYDHLLRAASVVTTVKKAEKKEEKKDDTIEVK